jgi:hypothetical protein
MKSGWASFPIISPVGFSVIWPDNVIRFLQGMPTPWFLWSAAFPCGLKEEKYVQEVYRPIASFMRPFKTTCLRATHRQVG